LGQAGQDSLTGDLGDDSLSGGDGNDTVSGGLGNDTVNGDAGNDSLFGNEGDDKLFGGSGNDTLDGFLGNDQLFGQGGSDSLKGGGGIDSLDGGAGADILDSADPLPDAVPVTITVAGGSVLEGNAGTTNLAFTLTLSAASFTPVTVNVSTADGTATAGSDYTAIANQLVTFAPGITTQTVNVQVNGDVTNEVDETVRLDLSNATNASLQNQEGIGTITNDDAPPLALFGINNNGLSIINSATAATTFVGNTGLFNVVDITADANKNLIGIVLGGGFGGPQIFHMNANSGQVTSLTPINGLPNGIREGDIAFDAANNVMYAVFSGLGNPSLFRINPTNGAATNVGGIQVLSSGSLADIGKATDDVEFDYLAFRPAAGAVPAALFGVISGGATGVATVNDALFRINTGTAVATVVGALGPNLGTVSGGLEWDASANDLLLIDGASGILARVNPATGVATPVGNTGLFNETGLTFAANPAVAPRSVSVSDISVTEGDQGTKLATFNVTAGAGNGPVTLSYATVDGTATAGTDYVATSGSLTFGAAGGTQTVSVVINGDYSFEADQTFFLQLSNVVGAAVADGSGVGTILNDDSPPLGDTLLGNTGNDTIYGGPANDFINGDGGADLIFGNAGNDTILGGNSADTINGGDGNDSIDGQGGPDQIESGNGDDIFVWSGASSGNDTVTNASGADGVQATFDGSSNVVTIGQSAVPLGGIYSFLQVSEGGSTLTVDSSVAQVTVDGGNGDDTITVTDMDRVCRGLVTVRGGKGDDLLTGVNAKLGQMSLSMSGGDGNDTIIGTSGDDTLSGDAGNDRIKAGLGNDLVFGGAGIDSINGDGGNDTLIGGDGTDTLVGDGADTLSGDAGNDSLVGGQGNDSLTGGDGNDTVSGGDGNDTVSGDNGNDSLLGDSGQDSINGGNGDDTIDGGRNDDILNGGAGNDKIRGDHGNDTIAGGAGDDTINGGDGDDVISGGDGDDTLLGGTGNDIIVGDQGDDSINGQSSTDTLAGGQGDDTIVAAAAGEVNEKFVLSAQTLLDLTAN
jgi:Ca2+-binding RTX toxin-like protein